jgi:hypothetical protein
MVQQHAYSDLAGVGNAVFQIGQVVRQLIFQL